MNVYLAGVELIGDGWLVAAGGDELLPPPRRLAHAQPAAAAATDPATSLPSPPVASLLFVGEQKTLLPSCVQSYVFDWPQPRMP